MPVLGVNGQFAVPGFGQVKVSTPAEFFGVPGASSGCVVELCWDRRGPAVELGLWVGDYVVVVVLITASFSRSVMATGWSQCGQAPPMPIRRAKVRQVSQRCSPRSRSPQSGHS